MIRRMIYKRVFDGIELDNLLFPGFGSGFVVCCDYQCFNCWPKDIFKLSDTMRELKSTNSLLLLKCDPIS